MSDSKKDGRRKNGGRRTGAGRPPVLINPVNCNVRLEVAMVEAIEKKGHNVSEFLRQAGERRLQEGW